MDALKDLQEKKKLLGGHSPEHARFLAHAFQTMLVSDELEIWFKRYPDLTKSIEAAVEEVLKQPELMVVHREYLDAKQYLAEMSPDHEWETIEDALEDIVLFGETMLEAVKEYASNPWNDKKHPLHCGCVHCRLISIAKDARAS
jgi:hypothetical protein